MLFTLLGDVVLPDEGGAWTSAVLAAFERMGVAEKATRQALMRTANAGWLRADKVGRRTRWLLTPAATRLLTKGARRIYSFGALVEGTGQSWDEQWVLVQVRIPETDRRARHVVRTRLAWAGFGSPGPRPWGSAHVARGDAGVPARRQPPLFVGGRAAVPTPGERSPPRGTCRGSRRSTSSSSPSSGCLASPRT